MKEEEGNIGVQKREGNIGGRSQTTWVQNKKDATEREKDLNTILKRKTKISIQRLQQSLCFKEEISNKFIGTRTVQPPNMVPMEQGEEAAMGGYIYTAR